MYALKDEAYSEEEMEEVDVYVVPRRRRKAFSRLLVGELVSLIAVILLFPLMTSFDFGPWTISVGYTVLPPQTLSTTVPVAKTGQYAIPASFSTGTLTIYNGGVLAQQLPGGFIVVASNGVEITLDKTASIPAGNPPSYGTAQVQAHAVVAGQDGNIAPLAVNSVIESSLFVKNKEPFTGGVDARTESYATKQDEDTALSAARYELTLRKHGRLVYAPNGKCPETALYGESSLMLRWVCEFLKYRVPSGLHVIDAERVNDHIILKVGL